MSKKMGPVEKLLKAGLKLISKKGGWCQQSVEYNGAYCAVGALWQWGAGEHAENTAREYLNKALPRGWSGEDVVKYNDKPGQRQIRIVNVYKRAIALAHKDGV
jgi:hypothetical protein